MLNLPSHDYETGRQSPQSSSEEDDNEWPWVPRKHLPAHRRIRRRLIDSADYSPNTGRLVVHYAEGPLTPLHGLRREPSPPLPPVVPRLSRSPSNPAYYAFALPGTPPPRTPGRKPHFPPYPGEARARAQALARDEARAQASSVITTDV